MCFLPSFSGSSKCFSLVLNSRFWSYFIVRCSILGLWKLEAYSVFQRLQFSVGLITLLIADDCHLLDKSLPSLILPPILDSPLHSAPQIYSGLARATCKWVPWAGSRECGWRCYGVQHPHAAQGRLGEKKPVEVGATCGSNL